jgi:MFS family permease
LWMGQSVSRAGSEVSAFALPTFAVLAAHATPLQLGTLAALQFLPYPVLGLVAGVWLDRVSRRSVMILADVARGVLLASVPAAAMFDRTSLLQLDAVALSCGICTVFFDVGAVSYITEVVPRGELLRANARFEISDSASRIAGGALGGVLVQRFGGAFAIGLDALSYAVSAVSLLWVRTSPRPVPERSRTSVLGELAEGLHAVFGEPALRTMTIAVALANLGGFVVNAVIFVFYYRSLGLAPAPVGIALGASSLGFAGAMCAAPVAARIGSARTLLAAAVLVVVSTASLPLASAGLPLVVIFATNALRNVALSASNVTSRSYRQAVAPPELQARINATVRTVMWSTIPIGSLLGGMLGGAIGVVPTIWAGAAFGLVAAIVLGTLPRRLPG